MSTHDHDDALEQKVLDAWRSLPKAAPSDALDDRILAMARRAVAAPGASVQRRPQWPVRLALAATVVLAAGVALKVKQVPSDSDRAVVPATSTPVPTAMPAPASPPAVEQATPKAIAPAPLGEDVPGGHFNGGLTSDDRDSRAEPDLQKSSPGPDPAPPASPPARSLSDKKLAPAAAAESPVSTATTGATVPSAGEAKQFGGDRPAEPAVGGKNLERRSADEARPFPAQATANAPVAEPAPSAPANPTPADQLRAEPRAQSEAPPGTEKLKAERAAGAGADAAARESVRGNVESTTAAGRPAPATVAAPPPVPPALSVPAPAPLPAPEPPAAPPIQAAPAKPTGAAAAAGPATGLDAGTGARHKESNLSAPGDAKAKDAESDRAAAAPTATTRNETTATTAGGRRDEGRAEQRKGDRMGLGGSRQPPAPKSAPPASPPATAPATTPRSLSDDIDRTSPEAWILAIQRLYALGERERAKEELLRLHKAFPDARVPEDLDAALK